MERVRRLAQLWSWLPAFRAVAETEHLHEASKLLHISPSALSRSIRLLEDEVGRPLFVRQGRTIALNEAGQDLLAALRDAMRLLDDSLRLLRVGSPNAPVRIATPTFLARSCVLPALEQLANPDGKIIPHVCSYPTALIPALLLRGELDVAFSCQATPARRTVVELLGQIEVAVYCGQTHPLFHAESPAPSDVLAHPFAVTTPDELPWPPEQSRALGMVLQDFELVVELCRAGKFLAVLPVDHPATGNTAGALRRLPVDLPTPVRVYAIHRTLLGKPSEVDAIIDAVRRKIGG